jgi:hypothetical protein
VVPSNRTRILLPALAVVLVAALAGVGYDWWQHSRQTGFARAVAGAPAGSERLSWTDWAGVRRAVGADVDARSSGRQVARFLDAAYDRDLTSRSALITSTPVLQSDYGFSPASADWELFSQGHEGAVITLGMPDGTDFDALADRLEGLGYPRPASATGVWAGGDTLLASISPDLTPELAYVALDADRHLVLASDQQAFLETAIRAATGKGDGVSGLGGVVDAVGAPLSAAVYTGDYACGALAMAQADPSDQAQADDLVKAAGTVDPYLAFAMAVATSGEVTVAMQFANDDQARTNADSRSTLAAGPAVGQGGSFADRFTLHSARADGSLLTLDLAPQRGQSVLSDLSTGPLLFATC